MHYERRGRADTDWAQWFLYYMHIEQLYSVFSNLDVYTSAGGKDNCLCVNRYEKGLHARYKGPDSQCRLMSVWKEEYVRFPANTVRLHWDGSRMGKRLY